MTARMYKRCPHGFIEGAKLCVKCEKPSAPRKGNMYPTANPKKLLNKCHRCRRNVNKDLLKYSPEGRYRVCAAGCDAPGGTIGINGALVGK